MWRKRQRSRASQNFQRSAVTLEKGGGVHACARHSRCSQCMSPSRIRANHDQAYRRNVCGADLFGPACARRRSTTSRVPGQRVAWRYSPFPRARLRALAWWPLGSRLAWTDVRLVVGGRRRLLCVSRARLSLSRSVHAACCGGRASATGGHRSGTGTCIACGRHPDTAARASSGRGCAARGRSAGRSAGNVVLLRLTSGLLPLRSAVQSAVARGSRIATTTGLALQASIPKCIRR